MKILITGATGFIGKHLIKALNEENHDVIVLARSSSETSFIDEGKVLISDQDFETLRQQFTRYNFDGIIHLASLYINKHEPDNIEDLFQSNVLLGTKVLEMAKKNNVSWFINTGTLFQHYNNENYNPVNLYAATKQAFEDIAKYYYETSDLNFVTLKLNDTYGANDKRKKIFNLWKEYAQTGMVLEMSPGEQLMDILHIDDVIDGFIKMVSLISTDKEKRNCGKSFSLKAEEKVTLKQLSHMFEKISGMKLNIKWGAINYRPREIMIPATCIPTLPNWQQSISYEDGFKDFLTN